MIKVRERIIKNAVKCLKCGDVIESHYQHDFVSCSCGNIFVDGGHAYRRMGGAALNDGSYLDLSQTQVYMDFD